MEIPSRLTTAPHALDAINGYLTWRKPERLEQVSGFVPWSVQLTQASLKRLSDLLASLARDPGLGPAVEAFTPGAGVRVVGKPVARVQTLRITEPERGAYGLVVDDPLAQLAGVATGVEMVRALATRCTTCAGIDRDLGRGRQAERLEQESAQLVTYAADLEQLTEPLAAVFLGQWRAEAVRRAPASPMNRPVRNVRLR